MLLGWVAVGGAPASADGVGVHFLTLSIHMASETIGLGEEYPRKVDDSGRHVWTPGVEVFYDSVWEDAPLGIDELRWAGGWFRDSMDQPAGYLALVPRWVTPLGPKWRFGFHLGAMIYFRRSWDQFPGYDNDGFYEEGSSGPLDGYQYQWLPSGKLEFLYPLGEKVEGVFALFPGIPYILVHYVGVRWEL